MSRSMDDKQLNELVRVARVAGNSQPGHRRTAYLSPGQLREASLPRLVTEVSRAEHPEADAQWRDKRRNQVADEFDRRDFPDAAEVSRQDWDQSRYDAEQARISREQAEGERARAEQARAQAQQTGVGTDSVVAAGVTAGVGVVGLAAASETLSPEQADSTYLANEHELSEQWSADMDDPTVAGESMRPTESGDLSVEVSDSLSSAPSASPEPAAPTSTVEQDITPSPNI